MGRKRQLKTALEEEDVPKKRRVPEEPKESNTVKDDPEESEKVEEEDDDDKTSDNPEVHSAFENESSDEIGWPKADIIELFNKIQATLPCKDTMVHTNRAKRLEWELIAFDNFSPSECKKTWTKIYERMRHHRTLKEILADVCIWVNQPWTEKHPDMPRHPPSMYLLFYKDNKEKVLAQNPDLDMSQLVKILLQTYRKLPRDEREKYKQMAIDLRNEYEDKLRAFHEQHPEFAAFVVESSKTPDPVELQEPRTAKQIFLQEREMKFRNDLNGAKNRKKANPELEWDGLSEEDRLMWIKEEENECNEKINFYEADNPELRQVPKTVSEDEDKNQVEGIPAPAIPPKTPYDMYLKIMLDHDEIISLPSKEQKKEISKRWNKLLEEEKQEYETKLRDAKVQYKHDYAAYIESLSEEERQKLTKPKNKGKGNKSKKTTSNNPGIESPIDLCNEIGWPKADVIELVNKIEATLPCNDIMYHSTRAKFLDWRQIAFNDYSTEHCKKVWMELHKRMRNFRILKDILADARIWTHEKR